MRGRVLDGELYAQILQKLFILTTSVSHRLQKLIYLYLFTDCVMQIGLQSSEQIFKDWNSTNFQI